MKDLGGTSQTTVLYVKDLSKSAEFYRQHFGAWVEHNEPGLFIQLAIREHSIRLVPHSVGREVNQKCRELQLVVPDLGFFIKRLSRTAIPHCTWLDPRGVSRLVFDDPDGNTVVLSQPPVERPFLK